MTGFNGLMVGDFVLVQGLKAVVGEVVYVYSNGCCKVRFEDVKGVHEIKFGQGGREFGKANYSEYLLCKSAAITRDNIEVLCAAVNERAVRAAERRSAIYSARAELEARRYAEADAILANAVWGEQEFAGNKVVTVTFAQLKNSPTLLIKIDPNPTDYGMKTPHFNFAAAVLDSTPYGFGSTSFSGSSLQDAVRNYVMSAFTE